MIEQEILKSQPISKIKSDYDLNFFLPFTETTYPVKIQNKKIALFFYVGTENPIDYHIEHINNLPENSDIFIISDYNNILKAGKHNLFDNYNVQYRLPNKRGRDLSSLLITCRDIFENYDYICCINNKINNGNKDIFNNDFVKQGIDSALKSKEYINNIISLFEYNEQLGLLTNPISVLSLKDMEINYNKEIIDYLCKKLNLSVPVDYTPVMSYGSMYWIKTKAFKSIFKYNLKISDFPQEPAPKESTILQLAENMFPLILQQKGYVTGWVMPDNVKHFTGKDINNIISQIIFDIQKHKYSTAEKIFSILNDPDGEHKILTLAGCKFKLKRNRERKNQYNSYGILYKILRKSGRILYSSEIKKNSNAKILVHLHLYYMESWIEIQEYLKNLEVYNYDLIVTYPEERIDESVLNNIVKFKPEAKLILYPNTGFDIGPFTDILSKTDLNKYDIIYHLHSKSIARKPRTAYNRIFKGKSWFKQLLDGTLGAFNIHKGIDILLSDNKYAQVCADNLLFTDTESRKILVKEYADRRGIKVPDEYTFVGGSCFGMTASMCQKIKELNLTLNDFVESRRRIFSFAHAFERIISIIIQNEGYKTYPLPVLHNNHKMAVLREKNKITRTTNKIIKELKKYNISDLELLNYDSHSEFSNIFFSGTYGGQECFIKLGNQQEILANEYNKQLYYWQNTKINVPKPMLLADKCKYPFFVMERLRGYDLNQFLNFGITKEQKEIILKELNIIKNEVTKYPYIHRDIRPENLIYDKDKLYLIDFQFAVEKTDNDNINKLKIEIEKPKIARNLGGDYKVAPSTWDDEFSCNKLIKEIEEIKPIS